MASLVLCALCGASLVPTPEVATRRRVPVHRAILRDGIVLPSRQHESPLTTALQAVHLSALAGTLAAPAAMDGALAALWHAVDRIPLTHDRMFEAELAVGAFVLWIFLFESLHLVLPNAASHRLDQSAPVRPLWGFSRQWWKSVVPAATYLGSIYVFHELHLGQILFGAKPSFDDPSYARVAAEVALGVFLYDALFYPFHLSFHKLRVGKWRQLHQRHHVWGRTEASAHNAIETVQNHYLDAGIQVSINILVQNISPWGFKHPLSRMLHNLMVTYLLCESHSGYDLPFMSHRLFPAVFGGSPRHEAHHRYGNVNFHQFFKWIDDALGLAADEPRRRSSATRASRKELARQSPTFPHVPAVKDVLGPPDGHLQDN
ncbi:hypothetical protein AB1Y20_006483 [Prymnesium parvum]|uniref:Fatty acid hydroxylase domain-containing protein n=1 Tax=Prymnesium parvum TaxID=97485 RepID=A0AB34IY84_PRYPA